MGIAALSPSYELRFRGSAKAFGSVGVLALQVPPDAVDIVIGRGFVGPRAIAPAALWVGRTK
jgi:hypothetical protein